MTSENPVYNRFDLVLLASQRSREITGGAAPTLDRHGHKNPVLALEEINQATVSIDDLQESLIQGFQQNLMGDEPEEDAIESQLIELMVEDHLQPKEESLEKEGFSIEEEDLFEDIAEEELDGEEE